MATTVYGEIRANLWHREMKPMHLLRAKLSFLGCAPLRPSRRPLGSGDFFSGRATLKDYDDAQRPRWLFDDWSFPVAPGAPSTASSNEGLAERIAIGMQKGFVGMGFTAGHADDAAAMVAWMQSYGLDGLKGAE